MAELDIVVFLRDRFAEDEFVAGQTHWGRCGIWRDFHEVCDCYAKPRALADVTAKRQMLDWCEEKLAEFARSDVWGGWPKIEAKQAADDILDLLALPYVTHPEFREEWK